MKPLYAGDVSPAELTWAPLGDEGRAGDVLRLVGVGRDVDQRVVADVRGGGRVERVERERRMGVPNGRGSAD